MPGSEAVQGRYGKSSASDRRRLRGQAMTRNHEKLLIAALCGMVICSAAAVAVQPAAAAGYHVESQARVSGVEDWDRLNIRKWPAPYSQKVGSLAPDVHVWVERCVVAEQG